MIGFIARFTGLWLIAGALVALVIDGTKTIAASALTVTPLGEAWADVLGPSSVMAAQIFVQRTIETYIGHWLWDPLIQWILMLPTWLVLGLLGSWLVYAGRKRRLRSAFAA
ncbi:MAG: hypothetical protein GY788_18715 [bacterium]|nr:hypothetical protein [bacterium]